MQKAAVLIALAVLAASALAAGAAPAAPTPLAFTARSGAGLGPEVSSNWSGYAATALDGQTMSFTDVTATWAQPKVSCTAGRTDAVAFWVGLGGDSAGSTALEQLGTEAECSGSSTTPRYSAWWEIVPAASVAIPLRLLPGDRVNAAVLVDGQQVTMSLKNLTRHTRFSKTLTLTQQLDTSSAEWIAEAPSFCSASGHCRAVPLTQFGTVTFTNAAAIGNGHPGTINDPAWTVAPIELISNGGAGRFFGSSDLLGPAVGAVPGGVSTDGRGFPVSWQQTVTPPGP